MLFALNLGTIDRKESAVERLQKVSGLPVRSRRAREELIKQLGWVNGTAVLGRGSIRKRRNPRGVRRPQPVNQNAISSCINPGAM